MDKQNNKRGAKCSEKQVKMLVECVKSREELISGKHSSKYTYRDGQNEWDHIAELLNAIPGAHKNGQGWRKCWHDLKSRTKCKEGANKKEFRKTGGGPSQGQAFSSIEEDILQIIKPVSIEGHNEIMESDVSFHHSAATSSAEMVLEADEEISWAAGLDKPSTSASPPIDSINETVSFPSKSVSSDKKLKKIPKRVTQLMNSASATQAYNENLVKKLTMKEAYYKMKIECLNKRHDLEVRKVEAIEKIAHALTNLSQNRF
ncbi:hypothetical protein Zmor_019794 [Zophobas morio]|uniref:Regulatory protein zeste n=1 Tax=Zophobas morio TaxID=2755281 RepID=A0AA38I5K3_9CUCU|nr:hypothetical protein Zmor_019794 [Zophobas morio]